MKPRLIFIHGNDTSHWSGSYCLWLKTELDKLGYPTFFETFPDSILARAEYWLPFLQDHVKAGESDVLIGWSSGAVAAMRYAENHRIKGSILIAPSYTDLGDDMEKQSGYYNSSWLWENIKNNQQKIALFYGDNDPYIPQDHFQFIISQLSPEVVKVPNARHFIEYQQFPELLEYIKNNY